MGNPMRDYHERSKHRLDRYAPGPGVLDWANQPYPWRTYDGTPRLPFLLAADDALAVRYNDLRRGALPGPAPLDFRHLGILFELSLALSAWKEYRGTGWALRCNPSSGNLHPTEAYLITPGLPGIDPGVYHYLSRDHVVEQRVAGEDAWTGEFRGNGILVALSSIYWREAWKYGIRAYRYCQHDCGHAIAALAYAAAALGWQTRVMDGAADDDIAKLVGLDRDADFAHAEREAPDVLMLVGEAEAAVEVGRLVDHMDGCAWRGRANRLSDEHVAWRDIDLVHAAAHKARHWPAAAKLPAGLPEAGAPRLDLPAAALFRQRRSAVAFDGVTHMPAEAFFAVLAALLPGAGAPPWSAWPRAPATVHLALFVHRVDGLASGLYLFLRDPAALPELQQALRPDWLWQKFGPPHLPLYLLLPSDLRQAAQLVSCHQEIAADSCFALGMLAHFALAEHEPWRYRELFWECGIIGQALYLEAEAAGLRGTGIGCFFDDEMHQLLGLRGHDWQSLYHFAVGGPVEDARLTTFPPYAISSRRGAL